MKMFEVGDRSPFLIDLLVEVWEDSVKNTHLFIKKRNRKYQGICATCT